MIITCEQRDRIGYIYLQKPNPTFLVWEYIGNREIEKYLDCVKPKITVEDGNKEIEKRINGLGVSDKNYLEDLDRRFSEEYLNDKDKEGYIVGIELNISKEELVQNVKQQVYKIHMIEWQQKYMLLTLAEEDKVFDKSNIIYDANGNKDTYYIISIEDDIVYIRGLLTRRLDLYPVEYLKEPYFILN